MTDHDEDLALLPELIDRSFGAGPPDLPSAAGRLAGGRSALGRRRRAGIAGVSLGVVVAVGVGVALSGSTGGHGADEPAPPVATQGTSSPSADASPSSSADT